MILNCLKKNAKNINYKVSNSLRLTPASTLTFVLSRKLLKAVAACAAPFLCNFRDNFALRFATAKTQMQVKRMLNGRCASVQRAAEPPPVVRRTAPSNMRIKLTAKLKSLSAFSLLAAYPPPVRCTTQGRWILRYGKLLHRLIIKNVITESRGNYSE